MKVPKIIFKPMDLEDNIDIIQWTFFENDGPLSLYELTITYYPQLKDIDLWEDKEIIYSKIEKVVSEYYHNNKEYLDSECKRFQRLWDIYNDEYLKKLSEYLNIDWSSNLDVIESEVGFIPVFPRFLKEKKFAIAPFITDEKIIKTCAHETCHFLWFDKWQKLYPECPSKEYDSPYLPWEYSEMVVDPIINSSEINDVLGVKEKAYDSFYELKNDDNYVMDELRNIYLEDISIEEKIIKGYEYIKKIFDKKRN